MSALVTVTRNKPFVDNNELQNFDFYDKLARKLTYLYMPGQLKKSFGKSEDAISEVFYQLVLADSTFDKTKNVPLKKWRSRRVKHSIQNLIRLRNKNQVLPLLGEEHEDTRCGSLSTIIEGDQIFTVDDVDNKEIFDKCKFSPEDKEILRLKLIEEKSYREIGDSYQLSHEWARKKIKKLLGRYYEFSQ